MATLEIWIFCYEEGELKSVRDYCAHSVLLAGCLYVATTKPSGAHPCKLIQMVSPPSSFNVLIQPSPGGYLVCDVGYRELALVSEATRRPSSTSPFIKFFWRVCSRVGLIRGLFDRRSYNGISHVAHLRQSTSCPDGRGVWVACGLMCGFVTTGFQDVRHVSAMGPRTGIYVINP